MLKIYVRERMKVGEGVKQPILPDRRRNRWPGADRAGFHFRKFEIEQIAKDIGAEVVVDMEPVPEEEKKKH